jgi:flagellar hook-associated protein 3 FlgL
MQRISTSMGQNNFRYQNGLNETTKNRIDGQMQSQRSVNQLRDNPVNAAHSIRFQSKITRLERYEDNAEHAINRLAVTEGSMAQAGNMMQRVRELTVQGANGTYSAEDLRYMALEVNEYLEELTHVANQKGADGLSLFSGTRTDAQAFRVTHSSVAGTDQPMITRVEYTGNMASRQTQYADGSLLETQFPGNRVFWAENQQVWGANNVANFVVRQDSEIIINNETIALKAGDSIGGVIARINQANVAVHASLDPVENTLVLRTTEPHQVWLQDGEGSTVLSDLGLIVEGRSAHAPNNYHSGARVSGGSAFDVLLQVRDALFAGDQERLGGMALAGIDQALDTVNANRAQLGARQVRLESVVERISRDNVNYKGWDNQVRGLNFADAITDLKMMEMAMQASYASASKILQPTLMDFLR